MMENIQNGKKKEGKNCFRICKSFLKNNSPKSTYFGILSAYNIFCLSKCLQYSNDFRIIS